MVPFTRMLLLAALLFVPRALFAQTAVDLTGHWEGTIQAPGMNAEGTELVGTLTQGRFTIPLTFRRAAPAAGKR